MIYEIRAYSPSKNEVQREFDQDALQGRPTDCCPCTT